MSESVFGVIGNTLRTASGLTVCIANPTLEMIHLDDIAHALARICRFGGHITRGFYSVGMHSIHCLNLARYNGEPHDVQLAVLLHDAAEAYLGDVIKPLKIMLPQYSTIEQRFEALIGEKFHTSFHTHSEAIKKYDHALLVAEKNVLLRGSSSFTFAGEHDVLTYPWPGSLLRQYPIDSVSDWFSREANTLLRLVSGGDAR